MLASIPAEPNLVVAGNHGPSPMPNYYLTVPKEDRQSEKEDYDEEMEILTMQLAKDIGITYLDVGIYSFDMIDRWIAKGDSWITQNI